MFVEVSPKARVAAVALALAGASLALVGPSASAQPTPYDDESAGVGGVTIYGPHLYARQPTTGAWVRMDSVSMTVRLADLNLATREGARTAKARIQRAARRVCAEAEYAYPKDVSPPRGCYQDAVAQGLAQAEDIAGYPIVAWGYR
jgi:UrcA family protein